MPKPSNPGKSPSRPPIQAARVNGRDYRLYLVDTSASARQDVERLEGFVFHAYLVGGCVRDLLVGGDQMEVVIATIVTPDKSRGLFLRAHIIGQRFRIV